MHQTVHNWVQRFGVELGLKCREHRYKKSSDCWHVDATYLKIESQWCYLYRAIDKEGNLVDVYLSDKRAINAISMPQQVSLIKPQKHRVFIQIKSRRIRNPL